MSGLQAPGVSEAAAAEVTHRCLPLYGDEALPLAMADRFDGSPNAGSPVEESDLAPFKPKCDVLVRATAWAPHGLPAATWPVQVRLLDDAEHRTRTAALRKRAPPVSLCARVAR